MTLNQNPQTDGLIYLSLFDLPTGPTGNLVGPGYFLGPVTKKGLSCNGQQLEPHRFTDQWTVLVDLVMPLNLRSRILTLPDGSPIRKDSNNLTCRGTTYNSGKIHGCRFIVTPDSFKALLDCTVTDKPTRKTCTPVNTVQLGISMACIVGLAVWDRVLDAGEMHLVLNRYRDLLVLDNRS